MSNNIQAIRGMHDIKPEQTPYWQFLEGTVRDVLQAYSYDEIRMPLVEKTELFKRSIGEVTDIVEKEMYTFEDRNGDSLTLRPEGTASCVRACMENGLLHNQVQRLWYMGPMFRHERPQKGRYRQFHQIGVEAFGMSGADIDAELILMSARMLKQLGLFDNVVLHINSLGTSDARTVYRSKLVEYFSAHGDKLDDDSQRRLQSNPLRILDSKNPDMQQLIEDAPKLMDHLDAESLAHFARLKAYLDQADIKYIVNPRLVRGLDYYSRTVFEWITDQLGAQGTVLAGGRFDGLVEQLGGKPTPAIGFAMGIERLVALLEDNNLAQQVDHAPHAYLLAMGESAQLTAMQLAEQLRDEIKGIRISLHCGDGSFKSQMKKADKSGANFALILGEDEINSGTIAIKNMQLGEQEHKDQTQLADYLATALGLNK
ncbi:MAG: histidine--tRNA ligase [Gammaproteobacteria bacterium]|nr:histidine--tRNA ligase [Gammaproteobacteria bacterium]